MKELTETRNHGDALTHSTRKALSEHGDKLQPNERENIEAAINALEEALRGNDKAQIDNKISALSDAAQKLGEKMYGDTQAQQAASSAASGASAHQPQQEDDVVDADFKEVKK
jgi:molecular chaperone DnaK